MLLSAQMAGKNVYLTGSGASTACSLEYPYSGALLLSNMTLENN